MKLPSNSFCEWKPATEPSNQARKSSLTIIVFVLFILVLPRFQILCPSLIVNYTLHSFNAWAVSVSNAEKFQINSLCGMIKGKSSAVFISCWLLLKMEMETDKTALKSCQIPSHTLLSVLWVGLSYCSIRTNGVFVCMLMSDGGEGEAGAGSALLRTIIIIIGLICSFSSFPSFWYRHSCAGGWLFSLAALNCKANLNYIFPRTRTWWLWRTIATPTQPQQTNTE